MKAGDLGTRVYPTFAKTPFSLTVLSPELTREDIDAIDAAGGAGK